MVRTEFVTLLWKTQTPGGVSIAPGRSRGGGAWHLRDRGHEEEEPRLGVGEAFLEPAHTHTPGSVRGGEGGGRCDALLDLEMLVLDARLVDLDALDGDDALLRGQEPRVGRRVWE